MGPTDEAVAGRQESRAFERGGGGGDQGGGERMHAARRGGAEGDGAFAALLRQSFATSIGSHPKEVRTKEQYPNIWKVSI